MAALHRSSASRQQANPAGLPGPTPCQGTRRGRSCFCDLGGVPKASDTTSRFSLAMGTLRRSAAAASPEAGDRTWRRHRRGEHTYPPSWAARGSLGARRHRPRVGRCGAQNPPQEASTSTALCRRPGDCARARRRVLPNGWLLITQRIRARYVYTVTASVSRSVTMEADHGAPDPPYRDRPTGRCGCRSVP
jgi:hypothetical protein